MERELEELEQEDLDKDLLGVPSTSELPEVPTGEIKEPAVAAKDKKKGPYFILICIVLYARLLNINTVWMMVECSLSVFPILFTVPAKAAEDDEDMKMLMSWAN